MLNDAIHYHENRLYIDEIPVSEIITQTGTPVYIYSLRRALANLQRIQSAFADLNTHIHYSVKANANLKVLEALFNAGAGADAVSAGEIYKALQAGINPQNIVFAGVGKSPQEIAYAVEQGVGWFNIENAEECRLINEAAAAQQRPPVQVALRLNPEVTANTHPYIATGHGGAKFGMTAEVIRGILADQVAYPYLNFAGIHIHIGSNLMDTEATGKALLAARELAEPYPQIQTLNIGGGIPVPYRAGEDLPDIHAFAQVVKSLIGDYQILLEPGRSIIADAGVLIANILYVKHQAAQTFYITDASMTELIRPALYQAHHEIVPLHLQPEANKGPVNVVGPVCETADVLGRDILIQPMQPNEALALLTAGAYGSVMASNYNARPLPAEVVVAADGTTWDLARRRQTWEDLLLQER